MLSIDPGYDYCPRRLVMQGDGNLVVYRGPTEAQCPNCPTWSTIDNEYGPYTGGVRKNTRPDNPRY